MAEKGFGIDGMRSGHVQAAVRGKTVYDGIAQCHIWRGMVGAIVHHSALY